MNNRVIRILLVDDHSIVREGIRSRLQMHPELEIAGEAANGREAVDQTALLQPDLVLMDISMPEMNGIDASRKILQQSPQTKILILSMHDHAEYVVNAMEAGVHGYILKDVPADEMINAIESIMNGRAYFSSPVSQALLKKIEQEKEKAKEPLTKRERTILALVAEGLTSKEIAKRLFISTRTVETHRLHIKKKLNIHSSAGLTKYAIESEIIKI